MGHIRFIKIASRRGKLTIVLNNDQWAIRKKGFVFLPAEERKAILESIKGVHRVITVPENDNNEIAVGKILKGIKCDIFQAGKGDSKKLIPVCKDLGITFIELKERGKDSKGHICSSTEMTKEWKLKE